MKIIFIIIKAVSLWILGILIIAFMIMCAEYMEGKEQSGIIYSLFLWSWSFYVWATCGIKLLK